MRTPRPPFWKEPPIGEHVDPDTRKFLVEIRELGRSQTWAMALTAISLNMPFYWLLMVEAG